MRENQPTWEVRTEGLIASGGSGRLISTLVAEERSLNWDRALTRYSVRLRLCLSTTHSTQISGFTFWLSRYVLHGRHAGAVSWPGVRHISYQDEGRIRSCECRQSVTALLSMQELTSGRRRRRAG